MPSFDRPAIFEEALYALLSGNASITALVGNNTETGAPNIYSQIAPLWGATYPMIVYQSRTGGGHNLIMADNTIVWNDDTYLVRAIGVISPVRDDTQTVKQLAYYIEQALHNKGATTSVGKLVILRCVAPYVPPIGEVAGVMYINRGGVYQGFAR